MIDERKKFRHFLMLIQSDTLNSYTNIKQWVYPKECVTAIADNSLNLPKFNYSADHKDTMVIVLDKLSYFHAENVLEKSKSFLSRKELLSNIMYAVMAVKSAELGFSSATRPKHYAPADIPHVLDALTESSESSIVSEFYRDEIANRDRSEEEFPVPIDRYKSNIDIFIDEMWDTVGPSVPSTTRIPLPLQQSQEESESYTYTVEEDEGEGGEFEVPQIPDSEDIPQGLLRAEETINCM